MVNGSLDSNKREPLPSRLVPESKSQQAIDSTQVALFSFLLG
jgi:hypothetical protein